MAERVSPWVRSFSTGTNGRVSTFCFPHAGGAASLFRPWASLLRTTVNIRAVQLPGREDRLNDSLFHHVDTLVPVLAAEIAPYCDRPFALFGHSMGAILAFEVTHELERIGVPPPLHVIVSGRRAPHLPQRRAPLHMLPAGEFEAGLARLGGMPPEVLQDPEMMALLNPMLRADFSVVETYVYRARPPLDVPLTVLGGADDPEVTPEELDAWRQHTSAFRGVRLFPGNHFYFRDQAAGVVAAIEDAINSAIHSR